MKEEYQTNANLTYIVHVPIEERCFERRLTCLSDPLSEMHYTVLWNYPEGR